MNKVNWMAALCCAAMVAFFSSCENEGCGESNISANGQDESHNMGQDCMNCHQDGGKGEGCFTVAGTAYQQDNQTYPNTTLKLYTQPQGGGELVLTLQGDANGNFFTTDAVNFYGGLYPAVTGQSGTTSFMNGPISGGDCNSCHGSTTGKIILP